MKSDSALAQRLIEERSEDEHEERRLKLHHAVQETQTDGNGNQCNRESCNQLEGERGDEGKAQDGEGRLSKGMAHLREMCALGIRAAKDLECHCRAHEFAESVRECLHLVPLPLARAARRPADEKEKERRNRQRYEEEQGG